MQFDQARERVIRVAGSWEEPRLPAALEPPGAFGTRCGDHETLRSNEATYRRAIVADDGARYPGL